MGKGPERGIHTASLPSFSVASVRTGIGGLTTICPCGNFGWVGTPYAFNVVLHMLDVITDHTIESAGICYVDDLNACSNRRTYVNDMSRVDDEVRTLLGPESMAAEKDKSGR